MRESRLFRILYYLLDKGHATAPELAKRFEVSVRTIYRDYVLDRSFFSDYEKQEILSGLQSLSAIQYLEADAILKKLGSIFQVGLADWIDVDFSRWGSIAENENRLFGELKRAIFSKHQVSFDYCNSSGIDRNRSVQPLKFIYMEVSGSCRPT